LAPSTVVVMNRVSRRGRQLGDTPVKKRPRTAGGAAPKQQLPPALQARPAARVKHSLEADAAAGPVVLPTVDTLKSELANASGTRVPQRCARAAAAGQEGEKV
jgi:hypothetical protein